MLKKSNNIIELIYSTNFVDYCSEIYIDNEKKVSIFSPKNTHKKINFEINSNYISVNLKIIHSDIKLHLTPLQKILECFLLFISMFLIDDYYNFDPWDYYITYKIYINDKNPVVKINTDSSLREQPRDKSILRIKTDNCEVIDSETKCFLDKKYIEKSFECFERDSKKYLFIWLGILLFLSIIFAFWQSFIGLGMALIIGIIFLILFFVGKGTRRKLKHKYMNIIN